MQNTAIVTVVRVPLGFVKFSGVALVSNSFEYLDGQSHYYIGWQPAAIIIVSFIIYINVYSQMRHIRIDTMKFYIYGLWTLCQY